MLAKVFKEQGDAVAKSALDGIEKGAKTANAIGTRNLIILDETKHPILQDEIKTQNVTVVAINSQRAFDMVEQAILKHDIKEIEERVTFYRNQNMIKNRLETDKSLTDQEATQFIELHRAVNKIARKSGQYSETFLQWRDAHGERIILEGKKENATNADKENIKKLFDKEAELKKLLEEERKKEQEQKTPAKRSRFTFDNPFALPLEEAPRVAMGANMETSASQIQKMDAAMFVSLMQHHSGLGQENATLGDPHTLPFIAQRAIGNQPVGKSTRTTAA